jgi:hypothetical protein
VRSSSSSKQTRARLRAVPWALLAQAGVVVGRRWTALSGKERARLASLLRSSRGRMSNLSLRERNELRKLVSKLDLKGAGRELRPLVRGGKRGRKRR